MTQGRCARDIRLTVRLLACVGIASLMAACSSDSATPGAATKPSGPVPSTGTASDPTKDVSVLGLWSGPEYNSFSTVASTWEQTTGGTVHWTGARDLPSELHAQIDSGTPPDIAILPNIGLLHELAAAGQLVPLDSVADMQQVRTDYSPAWLDLGSDNGHLYGIFYKVTSKATVWYSPDNFAAAGYTVPTTWDEMTALADRMVTDGRTPFSIVAPQLPGGGGWALTDWISQIVLGSCGTDVYDQWVAGTVPWTDPCIRQSFEQFLAILQTPGYVRGGTDGILHTSDSAGATPMYTDPPTAYMYYLASFAQAFIAQAYPQLTPGTGYDFFPFPTTNPDHAGSVTIGADVVVMLRDTPAARSFMTYLAGADSQQQWVQLGGFTSVNRSVTSDAYPDDVARAAAAQLASAGQIRFSAGDMMPPAVQQAWWKAMLQLVQDPSTLDAVLASMTATASAAR